MKRALLLTLGLTACASSAGPDAPPSATPRRAPNSVPAASGPSSSALDKAMAEDLAADRALPWSATWRLTWSNFQGSPPQSSAEGARTWYALYYAWSCKGDVFSFRVVAGFHPTRSWVKPAVVKHPAENTRVLRHEQTHFDITEVFARRMRRELSAVRAPCRKSDAELKSIAGRLVEEERQTQRRYDQESNHGLITNRQADWNYDVANMLKEVERYAQ